MGGRTDGLDAMLTATSPQGLCDNCSSKGKRMERDTYENREAHKNRTIAKVCIVGVIGLIGLCFGVYSRVRVSGQTSPSMSS